MTSTSKISVFFYNFDVQGNCYADIVLPISSNRISGFKVKLGPGGGIMVHMPSGMGTTWTFNEIEWAEVRKQITEEYRKAINNQPILVKLHDFDEKNNCLADITLRDTGVVISDFKVVLGLGGGIMVHMPSWMHTRWSYTEVQWSEVRQIVAREYLSAVSAKKQSIRSVMTSDGTQVCCFYSSVVRVEVTVEAIIVSSNEQIQGIQLVYTKDKNVIQVFMPREMNSYWNNTCIEWDALVEIITNEYRRQVLGENCESISDTVTIEFPHVQEVTICMVDVKLPHKKNIIKGFRIRKIKGVERIIISTPKWMGRWNDSRVTWFDLCAIIMNEYNKYSIVENKVAEKHQETINHEALTQNDATVDECGSGVHSSKQQPKEKNELGRIKNAKKSAFVFYPRTVLRAVASSDSSGSESKRKLFDLVSALNKGSLGGIGPFEINILEWIAKLHYVTSTMLLDLIKAGYVSFGWRGDVTQAKLGKIINRMADYQLITLTRFVTVNDDGSLENNSCSVMRIITLGRNGSILLHELGKNMTKYNAFDIFQDGNTVKRFLTANQWLVYWLKTYKDEIGEDYETSCVIHLKGIEYIGARIYATVTVNDCPVVAEPIRRVEEFEIDSNKQWLCEKIKRLSLLFDNLDQLYHGKDEISFPQRPTIVLVCEDDEHIFEVLETIKLILPEIHDQKIWFSSDLRIFNYDRRGERFLHFHNGELNLVNLEQVIGIDKEGGGDSDIYTKEHSG